MIFIWRRWGIVAPLIWFVSLWIFQFIADMIFGAGAYQSSVLLRLIGMAPASLAVWTIGEAMNEDISSNSNKHAFFFIPVEYWAIIFPAISLLSMIFF